MTRLLILLTTLLTTSAAQAGTLQVDGEDFRLEFRNAAGQVVLATTRASDTPMPVPAVTADGPMPLEPAGERGVFAPVGWLTGLEQEATIPASFFQGNRLFGAGVGIVVSPTRVARVQQFPDRIEYFLETNAGPVLAALAAPASGRPVAALARMVVRTLPDGSTALSLFPPAGLPVAATFLTFESPQDEGLYGLGARKDEFNQRGLLRNVWTEQQNTGAGSLKPVADPLFGEKYSFPNGDQAAYYVEAALFGTRGWGAWITQTVLSRLDLAHTDPGRVRWGIHSARVDLHVQTGGIEEASRAYTGFYGRAPAPPAYVHEPWMDIINESEGEAAPNGRGFPAGARVKKDAEELICQSEKHGIPLGVIGLEGWQTIPDVETWAPAVRNGTQPIDCEGEVRTRKPYRLMSYWNMFTSPESGAPWEEARDKRYFIRDPAGNDYNVITNRQGLSNLIDFFNPETWQYWEGQLSRSMDLCFEAWMHDFGELTTEGMVFHNGRPLAVNHNDYPVQYHRAARRAIDNYVARFNRKQSRCPTMEPFFYVRAGYNGVGAVTGGVFPGDESTDWNPASGLPSVIPTMLNLALTGSNAFTTDVGGYLDLVAPRPTEELYLRWSQLASFTPINRTHTGQGTRSVYPWRFEDPTYAADDKAPIVGDPDTDAIDVYRRYGRAMMELIPLKQHWSHLAAETGAIGPVRPLVLDDPGARDVGYQWLLGTDILVAPVLTPAASSQEVYFPAHDDWLRVRVGPAGEPIDMNERYAGGSAQTVTVHKEDIPLFVRASAVNAGRVDLAGGRWYVTDGGSQGAGRRGPPDGRGRPAK